MAMCPAVPPKLIHPNFDQKANASLNEGLAVEEILLMRGLLHGILLLKPSMFLRRRCIYEQAKLQTFLDQDSGEVYRSQSAHLPR